MKSRTLRLAFSALFLTGTLHAQVPRLINYQGRIAVGAVNFDGAGQFKFALVDTGAATTYWSNDGASVAGSEPAQAVTLEVEKGLYSVLLGDIALGNMAALPASVFTKPDVRLRVWFNDGANGWQRFAPDTRLAPAAYIADGAVTAVSIADGSIGAAKIAPASLDFSRFLVANPPGAGQVLGFNGASLNWMAPGGGDGIWTLDGANAFFMGNVGIGGTAGTSKLNVTGSDAITISGPGGAFLTWRDSTTGLGASISSANGALYYRVPNAANDAVLTAGYVDANGSVVRGRIAVEGNGPYITWADSGTGRSASISSANGALYYRVPNAANNAVVTAGYADANGSVVRGRIAVEGNGPYITWADSGTGRSASISSANGALYYRVPNAANDAVVTAGYADANGLVVRGRLRVEGAGESLFDGGVSCAVLTIRGGADVAEPFAMPEEIAKGSVVVIDDANPGQLKLSTAAYDNRVAGIVSGANGINPGIALHQQGVNDGGQNVALSGRVYVHADATSGAIKPGDLLTTSSTPGHAMKVGDHTRAQGAILGKAMSALDEGLGMVLVLVTLQ